MRLAARLPVLAGNAVYGEVEDGPLPVSSVFVTTTKLCGIALRRGEVLTTSVLPSETAMFFLFLYGMVVCARWLGAI